MISLRQHAVSLAAVFLALAMGVVLGSGFFSDTLLSSLRSEAGPLRRSTDSPISGMHFAKSSARQTISISK